MKIEIPDEILEQLADIIVGKLQNAQRKSSEIVLTIGNEAIVSSDENLKITFDEVKSEFARLKRIHKTREAKELLKQFGVIKVSEIKEEDYLNIMEIARSIN